MRILLVALLTAVLAIGCQTTQAGDPGAVVRQWLGAAAGDADDRGWSLVHPYIRADIFGGDAASYAAAAAEADWTALRYKIVDASWDDPRSAFVQVQFEDPATVPSFLTSRQGSFFFADFNPEDGSRPYNARFIVRRDGPQSWTFAFGG